MISDRLINGSQRLWMQPDWPRFAGDGWEARIMQLHLTDRLHKKQGRSIVRWQLRAGSEQLTVYLKRHHRLPRWLGWLSILFPGRPWSPALQEWHHLQQARQLGVPVPEAVAAGEMTKTWGTFQSFLVVKELEGMLPLHEAIPLAAKRLSGGAFANWKRGLLTEMARLARLLHERAWFHKDLYLCHFYVPENDIRDDVGDWKNRVYLIDFHRLGRHPWTKWFWQVKDLAQLLYSSQFEGISNEDRREFWWQYTGGRSKPWLARLVRWKAQRYRRHNRSAGARS
ncbi:MAG TPA: lipopolysaccharide kinase InaA family protein [Gemmataceae bacterium]|nr:lipopolysaccharide kinase InaA family protein [Gemmataceae bacterium]